MTAGERQADLFNLGAFPSAVIEKLAEMGYFMAPAAKSHHSNYPGGLYDHSKCVADYLRKWTDAGLITWHRKESPEIVGYLHDLCKTDDYLIQPVSGEITYNPNTIMPGHGSKSLAIIGTLMTLTYEEMLCVRFHMGAYEKDEWNEYGRAVSEYPNVAWVHLADMLASHYDNK